MNTYFREKAIKDEGKIEMLNRMIKVKFNVDVSKWLEKLNSIQLEKIADNLMIADNFENLQKLVEVS